MDKISWFSDDELLVKILSFLPTKVAVSTSVLSKQWKFLWMRVPKLEYDDSRIYYKLVQNRIMPSKETKSRLLKKSKRMRDFIDRNLPLHSSPVIESLCLTFFTLPFQPKYIKLWVMDERIALLPNRLYTCKSLVKLKLIQNILVDVPHVVCLPSLKTLHLERVAYADEKSLQRLLSNCPVLEDLIVELCQGDNVRKFAIIIPSLLSLSFMIASQCCSDGYVIDTPSLKYFKATDFSKSPSSLIVNMPELKEARITVRHNIKKLLEPVTSVKFLSLHIINTSAEAVYGDEIVFKELEHLNFFIKMTYWSKLLFWLLNASPKLRVLWFSEYIGYGRDTMVFWKQLTSVPQCLLSTLQTFTWLGDDVISVEGKDLATYILRNSCRLKTARISIPPGLDPQKKLEMETEMKFSSRGSPTCNLVFS